MTALARDRSFAGHRRSATIRNGLLTLSIFAAALALCAGVRARPAFAAQIEVCFSPPLPGGCDPNAAVVSAIASARRSILVQAYEITSGPLVTALIDAHRRGVDVRAIVDYKQFTDRRNHDDAFAVRQLGAAGIPVLLDRPPGLMHDKVMIVDDQVVVTGSFNYTYSAEHRNVENLLVIRDPALAAQYLQHWKSRAVESRPLFAGTGARSRQSSSALDGRRAHERARRADYRQPPQSHLRMARMSLLQEHLAQATRRVRKRASRRAGRLPGGAQLPMT